MTTVTLPQSQLSDIIADVNRGQGVLFTDGNRQVTLFAGAVLDPNIDSPELEAELLKSIDQPLSPYSADEMRKIGEEILKKLGK